jgi:hypothetical protein
LITGVLAKRPHGKKFTRRFAAIEFLSQYWRRGRFDTSYCVHQGCRRRGLLNIDI